MRRTLFSCSILLLAACGSPPPAPQPKTEAKAPASETKTADAKATETKTSETKAAKKKKRAKTSGKVEPTYEAQLAALDDRITGQTTVTERNPRSSSAYGRVASLYLARARLSGDYDDYAKAEEMIDKAFEVSPSEGYGPFMVRARLNFTLHRLDRVDEDFTMATKMPTRDGRALHRRMLFAGNLALQRGEYEEARKLLEGAIDNKPSLTALASLAQYHWKSADFDEAEKLYREGLEDYSGSEAEPRAWVHLQLGLMDLDRGRYDEALAHYREGEALIRGYWLIEEHIAEILTLQGQTEKAKELYQSIIDRTNNPEFMDSMAGIAQEAGDTEGAAQWIARARARYEEQMKRFPEAAYGHALEHFLEFGDDPARTVDLAERNHALRPNADAKRLLADAYLGAKRVDDARARIEEALATPMRSADLHATAAAVYAAAGDETKAQEHRDAARAINPKIELE